MDPLATLLQWLPSVAVLVGFALTYLALRSLFARRHGTSPGERVPWQLMVLALALAGQLALLVALPLSETLRGQLIGLFGVVISATLALSATTFVGNLLAGIMLRALGAFRAGDFIRVGEHFGRISERGLFHTEIQTEDRDLTTLPNLFLVTNPVKVVRSSGTILSATVSLGYEVPRQTIEAALLEGAHAAGLSDPFVHVEELGDFSVVYRVAGLLEEVKQLLSARSRLRVATMDALHAAGVEIVSPTYMNTRALAAGHRARPRGGTVVAPTEPPANNESPEAIIFDKADQAESLESLAQQIADLDAEREALKTKLDDADTPESKAAIQARIAIAERRRDLLQARLDAAKG